MDLVVTANVQALASAFFLGHTLGLAFVGLVLVLGRRGVN